MTKAPGLRISVFFVVLGLAFASTAYAAFGLLSGPSASPGQTSVAIAWENEQPGDGYVFLGLTPDCGDMVGFDGTTDVFTHVVELTGLSPSTQYFYQVRSFNSSGDVVSNSDTLTFVTQPAAQVTMGTLSTPDADPRRVLTQGTTILSARLHQGDLNIAGAPVTFTVSSGNARLQGDVSAVTVNTDSNGIVRVQATAGNTGGVVKMDLASPNARNNLQVVFVVER